MKNNSSWFSKFRIIIDSNFKTKENELFHSIQAFLNANKFTITGEEEKNTLSPFDVYITIHGNEVEMSFNLSFKEKNMSLFQEEESRFKPLETFGNLDEFTKSFNTYIQLIKIEIEARETKIFKDTLKTLKKDSSTKQLNTFEYNEQDQKIIEDFELELFKLIDKESLANFVESYNKKVNFDLFLIHPKDIKNEELEICYPLVIDSNLFILAFNKCTTSTAISIYGAFSSAVERISLKDEKNQGVKELDNLFSKLDIPLAIFDLDQNLVLHNDLFIKLNLSAKECFGFKINEQITIDSDIYKVQKILNSENNLLHLNFIPVNEVLGSSDSPSSEELGIVSSSIAHELNNPLAGVLAALNVLELDDYSDEIHEKFDQMKESVGRCKKLVETFLGFSKINNQNHGLTSYGKDSFYQAMELIRFRLIENNITINYDYSQKEKLSYPVNSHVLSMIFYFFLGELLTSFSHQNLVELKNIKRINLDIIENYNGIEFKYDERIILSDNITKSKLIEHLIEGEKMQLKHSLGSLSLIYKEEFGKL